MNGQKNIKKRKSGQDMASLNNDLFKAITPWIGNIILPAPVNDTTFCEGDVVGMKAEEIDLPKTAVFSFFLKAFKFDIKGCRNVIEIQQMINIKRPVAQSKLQTVILKEPKKNALHKKPAEPPHHPPPLQQVLLNPLQLPVLQMTTPTLIQPKSLVITQPNKQRAVQPLLIKSQPQVLSQNPLPLIQPTAPAQPVMTPVPKSPSKEDSNDIRCAKRIRKPTEKVQALLEEAKAKGSKNSPKRNQGKQNVVFPTITLQAQPINWIFTPTNFVQVAGPLSANIPSNQTLTVPNSSLLNNNISPCISSKLDPKSSALVVAPSSVSPALIHSSVSNTSLDSLKISSSVHISPYGIQTPLSPTSTSVQSKGELHSSQMLSPTPIKVDSKVSHVEATKSSSDSSSDECIVRQYQTSTSTGSKVPPAFFSVLPVPLSLPPLASSPVVLKPTNNVALAKPPGVTKNGCILVRTNQLPNVIQQKSLSPPSASSRPIAPSPQVVAQCPQIVAPSPRIMAPSPQIVAPLTQIMAPAALSSRIMAPAPQTVASSPRIMASSVQVMAPSPQYVTSSPRNISPPSPRIGASSAQFVAPSPQIVAPLTHTMAPAALSPRIMAPAPQTVASSPRIMASSVQIMAPSPQYVISSPRNISPPSPRIGASSAQFVAPSPQIVAPLTQIMAPAALSPRIMAPAPQTVASSPRIMALSVQIMAPSPQYVTSSPRNISPPLPRIGASSAQFVAPSPEIVAPLTQIMAPATLSTRIMAPAPQTVASSPRIMASSVQIMAPSPQYVSSSPQNISPPSPRIGASSAQFVAPLSQFVAPSSQIVASSPQFVAPSSRIVASSPQFVAPSPQIVASSAPVVAPSVCIAAPTPQPMAQSTRIAAPLPRPMAPSVQIVAPSPQVVVTSPHIMAPSPQIEVSSHEIVAPSPRIIAPSPQIVAPQPQVAAPSAWILVPSPQILAPTPQIVAPSVISQPLLLPDIPSDVSFNPHLIFPEQSSEVDDWINGKGGIPLPDLETSLPYLPPFATSIKTLTSLLKVKQSLLAAAVNILPVEYQNYREEEAQVAAIRKMIAERLASNPAYQLLKARFMSCFTLPALLATINPSVKCELSTDNNVDEDELLLLQKIKERIRPPAARFELNTNENEASAKQFSGISTERQRSQQ